MSKIIKIFEVFTDKLPELTYILDQISNRIKYWFNNQESAFSQVNFVELQRSTTRNSPTQEVWFQFNDDTYMYKVIIFMNIEDLEHCNLVIHRYKNDDEFNLYPDKYMENDIKVNDIKEDFIMNKISKIDEKDENPDDNRIETAEPEEVEGNEQSQEQNTNQNTGQQTINPQTGEMPFEEEEEF